VILYRLITGNHPHDLDGTIPEVLRRIADSDVIRPQTACPTIAEDLEALLLKCLAKDPDLRYASADELARDIGNYLENEPVSARRATILYFLRKRLAKYRWRVTTAVLAILALVVGIIWSYIKIADARTRAVQAMKGEVEQRIGKELQIARYRLLRAHSLSGERRWDEAREQYVEAHAILKDNKLSVLAAELGIMNTYATASPAAMWWSAGEPVVPLATLHDFPGCKDGHVARAWDIVIERASNLEDQHRLRSVFVSSDASAVVIASGVPGESTAITVHAPTPIQLSTAQGDTITSNVVFDSRERRLVYGVERRAGENDLTGVVFQKVDGDRVTQFVAWPDARIRALALLENGTVLLGDRGGKLAGVVSPNDAAVTFEGTTGEVYGVTICTDQSQAISADDSGTLAFWDIKTRRLLREVRAHTDRITAVAVSPDGKWLLSGDRSGKVNVWELPGLRLHRVISQHVGAVRHICTLSGGFAMTMDELLNARLWPLHPMLELRVPPPRDVERLACTDDGSRILLGHAGGKLVAFDPKTRKSKLLHKHKEPVLAIGVAGGGQRAVSVDRSGEIAVHDLAQQQPLQTILSHQNQRLACGAISNDTSRVAIGGTFGVTIFKNGAPERTFGLSDKAVFSTTFTPDGNSIIAATLNGRVEGFDIVNGSPSRSHALNREAITASLALADQSILLGTSTGRILQVNSSGQVTWNRPAHNGRINALAMFSNSRLVFSGSQDGTLRLSEIGSDESIVLLEVRDPVTSVAVANAPESVWVGVNGSPGLYRWDLSSARNAESRRSEAEKALRRLRENSADSSARRDLILWHRTLGFFLENDAR
jgi:WD40 repeat protein